MKFTTLIPTSLNDGTPVSAETLIEIEQSLAQQFGGCTVEGIVTGYWQDDGGTWYHDTCEKLAVVCENDRLAEAEAAVREIGSKLEQKAMYFEVRDLDGVRFLKVD